MIAEVKQRRFSFNAGLLQNWLNRVGPFVGLLLVIVIILLLLGYI